MNSVKILDSTIKYVGSKESNINDIPTITFYFNRLVKTSMLPIEVTIVKIQDSIKAFSPQLNSISLEEDEKYFYYKNDIIFNKEFLTKELKKQKALQQKNSTYDIFKKLFGIDLSNVKGVHGLVFDKILFVENFPVNNINATSDGYLFVFTDMGSRKSKQGFFVGNVRPLKHSEYVERLSKKGASSILNDVVIECKGDTAVVTNNNEFIVEVQPIFSDYKVESKELGEKVYTRTIKELTPFIVRPNQKFEFSLPRPEYKKYTLFSNPIKYVNTPISTIKNKDVYIEQLEYIKQRPVEFKLKSAGLPIPDSDLANFFVVTSFCDISELESANKFILNKNNNSSISIESNEWGSFYVNNMSEVYSLTQDGLFDVFFKDIKTTALFKLNSEQFSFIYSIPNSKNRIVEVSSKTVYNNVLSEHQEAFVCKVATLADLNEFVSQNQKIKIDREITSQKNSKLAAVPVLLKHDTFKTDAHMISIFDISDSVTRKSYHDYIFKTYNREIDAITENYLTQRKQAASSYKFLDFDLSISSSDISQVSPNADIWDTNNNNEERNNFVYQVKYHLEDLGYEIALDEALKKIKKMSYIYEPILDTVAIQNIGITLDHKWYFCGADFYKAEEIEKPKITTFLDNKLKEYLLDTDGFYRFLFSKNVFFGYSNDAKQETETAKQLLLSIANGEAIDPDVLMQNPALNYIMSHIIDSNETAHPMYEDIVFAPANVLYKETKPDIKNKFIFPNIFKQDIGGKFNGDGIFKSAKTSELEKSLKNNATDVLDSVSKIRISTSVYSVIDINSFKKFSNLFKVTGYQILGVELTDIGHNDFVKFSYEYVDNVIVDGYSFNSGYIIRINNKERFGIFYNYLTKKSYLKLSDNVNIVDYAFIIAMLDTLTHYNVDYIEGYKYNSLGEYRIENDNKKETESKYLYYPISNPTESDYILLGISVNLMNKSVFYDNFTKETISFSSILGKIDNKEVNYSLTISKKKNSFIISKTIKADNEPEKTLSFSINETSVTNTPFKTIPYAGMSIIPYRVKKFMPMSFREYFLRRVAISVNISKEFYYLNLEFGVPEYVETENEKYVFILSGDGVVMYKAVGNSISTLEVIVSLKELLIDAIQQKTYKDIDIEINRVIGGKI